MLSGSAVRALLLSSLRVWGGVAPGEHSKRADLWSGWRLPGK